MALLLKGKDVAAAITERSRRDTEALKAAGVTPTLAILRVGEKDSDLSYERGAVKRCAEAGVEVRSVALPEDAGAEEFYGALDALNKDPGVHGILMFRPLPAALDNEKARLAIAPEKDVDGCTDASLCGVFTGRQTGFAPCTAQAVIEMLDYYGIEISGKRAVVLGRSLVVGRPAAMLLMARGATVTVCHTKTKDAAALARGAEILVTATGQTETVGAAYAAPAGQVIIDVGISWSEAKGKLCGDCVFEELEPLAAAITPVPGGFGAVTTSVLVSHVVEAAKRITGK